MTVADLVPQVAAEQRGPVAAREQHLAGRRLQHPRFETSGSCQPVIRPSSLRLRLRERAPRRGRARPEAQTPRPFGPEAGASPAVPRGTGATSRAR